MEEVVLQRLGPTLVQLLGVAWRSISWDRRDPPLVPRGWGPIMGSGMARGFQRAGTSGLGSSRRWILTGRCVGKGESVHLSTESTLCLVCTGATPKSISRGKPLDG